MRRGVFNDGETTGCIQQRDEIDAGDVRRKERPAKNESRSSVRLLRILGKENGLQSSELAERMEIRASSLTKTIREK